MRIQYRYGEKLTDLIFADDIALIIVFVKDMESRPNNVNTWRKNRLGRYAKAKPNKKLE